MSVVKNGYFWTTFPPHLVHVVIERPQKCPFETWTHPIYCMWSARLSPHAFMYVLYYPYYVYSNSFVLYYILEQLLDPLRSNILIHMYSILDILGYPLFFGFGFFCSIMWKSLFHLAFDSFFQIYWRDNQIRIKGWISYQTLDFAFCKSSLNFSRL